MRRFGSSPETRAIAPATLQAAGLGAILLAATILLFGPTTWADFGSPVYFAWLALLMLIAGFIFGGLGTGLLLMLAGVPLARIIGQRLENTDGAVLALASAAIGVWVFHAFAGPDEFFALASACFALPAAWLYRRQVLLERAFERP
ncbi:MAG: hypothetical protein RSE14_11955 [Erythrobacter sp.]|uniref:hypothetical protein n=1 Tax=Erythrobacter sp. TaxID=1042 RepID=UPI002B49C7D2|nr:hypothetical protein [Erythrobacter sp.]WRH69981.1 MAG: hypothetical protein RSE14_11955 [Erythrobacter sp.]